MLKKLTRKFVTLSVLVLALAAVPAAPSLAQTQSECYFCKCSGGRCICVPVECPPEPGS